MHIKAQSVIVVIIIFVDLYKFGNYRIIEDESYDKKYSNGKSLAQIYDEDH